MQAKGVIGLKFKKTASLMTATLVLGLVLGNVVGGWAAAEPAVNNDSTATTATAQGLGLRLGAAMRDAGGRLADIVAKLTGQDVDAVIEERAAGKSFADIAESEGVSSDAVVDEALKVRKELLDARVKDGSITQEQADAALDRMSTRLADRVDSTDAGCNGAGGGGRGGGMGRGGMGGGMGRGAGGCGMGATQAPAQQ